MTLRCVIVDDNPDVLLAASKLLAHEGIGVVGVAATSQQALGLMQTLQPDVMLVDIYLGSESGFDLARRLAQIESSVRSRTILYSTHDEQEFAALIAASPAIGFLPKSALSAAAIYRLLARGQDEESC